MFTMILDDKIIKMLNGLLMINLIHLKAAFFPFSQPLLDEAGWIK